VTSDLIEPWLPGSTPASQMLWLSSSYAEAARVLCEAMETEDFTPQYTSTRVVLHLCRHATELYLKGAIGVKTGRLPTNSHRLDHLYAQYKALYPQADLHFDVPFSRQLLMSDDDLFPGTLESYQKTHDQRYRYPIDSKGMPFHESEPFDIPAYKKIVNDFWQSLNMLVVRIDWIKDL
jgi:hypothetical protein